MTAVVTPGAGAAATTATASHDRSAHRAARHPVHPRPPAPERTLELEVVAGGDPVRLARILATLVNNSPMALAEVRVGEHDAYPVPDRTVVTERGPMQLTLRLRDTSRRLDGLVVEEVVALVSGVCRVVRVGRP